MGLFDRLSRLVRADLNALIASAENPAKILDQTVLDMEEDLIQLRQAVVQAMASKTRTEQQYNQNNSQAVDWTRRAQLALQKGDEPLAREALGRKKSFAETAAQLKVYLDTQAVQVDQLKRTLIAIEGKIAEAKTKKTMLKARADAAKIQERLQTTVNNIGTSGSIAAFERMEQKVLDREARAMAMGELAGADLESKFATLEAGSDIDDELAAMKARMLGPTVMPVAALPVGSAAAAVALDL
jgi:phage shock protein A